jgi:hypothetical protein
MENLDDVINELMNSHNDAVELTTEQVEEFFGLSNVQTLDVFLNESAKI